MSDEYQHQEVEEQEQQINVQDIKDSIYGIVDKEHIDVELIRDLIQKIQQLEINDAIDSIKHENYHIIRLMCREAGRSIDTQLVTEIVQFINGVSNEIKEIINIIIEEQGFKWIIPNLFMVDERTTALYYLDLINFILTQDEYSDSNSFQNEFNRLDSIFLESLIDLALVYNGYYDTAPLYKCFYTMFGYQKNTICDNYSPLVRKLYSIQKAPEFGPELIALLNRDIEYKLLPQCLSLINDLFSFSQEFNIGCFFYTLDIKVIIDIIIREIHNLDEMDPARWQYLEVLSNIIDHSEYQKLEYKVQDIRSVVSDLLDERSTEKDPISGTLAQTILNKLQNFSL
ncbi:hypothetical protein CYY_000258 [Polysphondylium violaceum]|uniref:SPIN90/Ldb17 leucine-rich domain-containing protein n=1 Tax=Polysphondylium violaceum TaxID=133409 RepID=A0A8J4UXA7_9MYCE|nr:hypothetical protein CYY_000258 [Polysphondylium violaceum]